MKNAEKQKSDLYQMNINYNSNQYSSTFSTNAPKSNKYSTNKEIKKDINIIDFIGQKQKFKMEKFFDEKRTKKFLKLKNEALMEIQLDDEKISSNDKYDDKCNNNKHMVKNVRDKENKELYKYKSTSPRKKRVQSKKNIKENKEKNEKKLININSKSPDNNEDGNNSIIEEEDDSNDMECIYKLIINNINENEDILDKKLDKEIERIESKKISSKIKSKYNSNYSCSPKYKRKGFTNKKFNNIFASDYRLNPFEFSDIQKDLMVNDDIEASSISDKAEPNKNNTTKNLLAFNNKDKNNLFDNKNMAKKFNEIEKSSEYNSLKNLLYGLMENK